MPLARNRNGPRSFAKTAFIAGLLVMTSVASGFDLQGHRGARGLMPENTLPGFATALAIGVTTLELDLAVSGDGAVVVSHNPHFEPALARDASGEWLQQSSPAINSMNLATVKSYDVGRLNPSHKYAQHYPWQQAIDGASVPTLSEVFDLVNKSGNQSVRFNIEIKINPEHPSVTLAPKEFVTAALEVIRDYQMEDRVTLQSFNWRVLHEVQQLAAEIATSYLTADQSWLSNLQSGKPGLSPWLNGLDIDDFGGSGARAIKAAGGDIWSSYHQEVDADAIKLAHHLGLQVNVWTVNDTDRMHELIAMGVDGIITDYPDRLRQVAIELGLPVPLPTPVDY
ncbi:glycerophosphodiester phosphodiesterase [Gammaproteobacteria bacterium]|nr:glycerophosphodiester phosphodiesterase [Gammaproteobacteria bacterium]